MKNYATQYIENYYAPINPEFVDKFKTCYISKKLLHQFKKENNLLHVKRKVWYKGILLKTFN